MYVMVCMYVCNGMYVCMYIYIYINVIFMYIMCIYIYVCIHYIYTLYICLYDIIYCCGYIPFITHGLFLMRWLYPATSGSTTPMAHLNDRPRFADRGIRCFKKPSLAGAPKIS